MSQRRNFGAVFTSKEAVAAIQGAKTLNEIASQYEVHPNQTSQLLNIGILVHVIIIGHWPPLP